VLQHVHPKLRFVGLLDDDSQAANEFPPRPTPAGGSVIRHHARPCPKQLRPNKSHEVVARQGHAQVDHIQRKPPRPFD
jgi:hypothetical protein